MSLGPFVCGAQAFSLCSFKHKLPKGLVALIHLHVKSVEVSASSAKVPNYAELRNNTPTADLLTSKGASAQRPCLFTHSVLYLLATCLSVSRMPLFTCFAVKVEVAPSPPSCNVAYSSV